MKRALLVIDVQMEYFSGVFPIQYPENSFQNIIKAMDEAIEQQIPVFVIQHGLDEGPMFVNGSPEWDLHPEIKKRNVYSRIQKRVPGSFYETTLKKQLDTLGIETVTISGYMSQICCDHTAREAFQLGYEVEFLSGATGTLAFKNTAGEMTAEELHRATLVSQATYYSQVLSTNQWITKLKKNILD